MTRVVTAVIPTFNGLSLLKTNLPAVIKCLRDHDELLIIDDAGTDPTIDWLIQEFQLQKKSSQAEHEIWTGSQQIADKKIIIKFVVNKHNLRFAATVNQAVQLATGELILLLNNDVSPHKDLLDHLSPYFSDPQVFAVGCAEHEPNHAMGGKNKLWFGQGLFQHTRATEFLAGPTAWASGGSAMFDKQKWLGLGGFDVAYYPAYWEDVDLSFRARHRGWKVLFEPQAVVNHNHESTNQDVFGQQKLEKISWKNANYFAWKNGNIGQKISNLMWRPYWWLKRLST